MIYLGSCHCGAVNFEIETDLKNIKQCNCSICKRKNSKMNLVSKDKLKITKGEDNITLYEFGTKQAKHYFCNVCGIKSFYIPRSHPNSISVNARCIDEGTIKKIKTTKFDGKNWEKNIDALKNN